MNDYDETTHHIPDIKGAELRKQREESRNSLQKMLISTKTIE